MEKRKKKNHCLLSLMVQMDEIDFARELIKNKADFFTHTENSFALTRSFEGFSLLFETYGAEAYLKDAQKHPNPESFTAFCDQEIFEIANLIRRSIPQANTSTWDWNTLDTPELQDILETSGEDDSVVEYVLECIEKRPHFVDQTMTQKHCNHGLTLREVVQNYSIERLKEVILKNDNQKTIEHSIQPQTNKNKLHPRF